MMDAQMIDFRLKDIADTLDAGLTPEISFDTDGIVEAIKEHNERAVEAGKLVRAKLMAQLLREASYVSGDELRAEWLEALDVGDEIVASIRMWWKALDATPKKKRGGA